MSTNPVSLVRIKDIADHLRISTAAVSQALNDSGRLSPKLRTKILREAEAMGYRKNRNATDLAMHRWRNQHSSPTPRNIAFLTNVDKVTRPYVERLGELAESYTRKAGHGFIHIEVSKYSREPTWKNLLKSRGIEGIIAGTGFNEAMLQEPFWNDFVVVKCGLLNEDDQAHGVQEDVFSRIHRATDILESRNYRRVGFALLHHTPYNNEDLLRLGALRTLSDRNPNLTLVKPFLFPFAQLRQGKSSLMDPSNQDFQNSIEPLIPPIYTWAQKEKPDVIVGMNDLVFFALTMGGFKIPNDAGFISLNASRMSEKRPISPAGFWQNREKLVLQSFQLLEQLLQSPIRVHGGPIRTIVPNEFHEGNTCPITKNATKPC